MRVKRYVLGMALGSLGTVFLLAAGYFSLHHNQSQPDPRMLRARALFETENYLAALKVLQELPSDRSNGIEAHSYLGAAYLQLHLYQAAIQEFQEAGRRSPRQLDPWIGLASAHIRVGDGQRSEERRVG